ncbi:putative transcriptional regulator [Pararheinheimera phage vB_PsoM_KLER1-1]|nr:putative transcriptional regulator [Pararheinheimera phage vB_PsoM_KLER1-1]
MNANKQAANNIKKQRKLLRHEPKQMAAWTGIKMPRYYAIERGDAEISINELTAIAKSLETTAALLLGGSDA